ncbi:general secretion pathway protein GspK [Parahaliea maris]|uniref:General secretion pathway protein GspK n=1 Tax=Parahaliea maris TaxID=2716870 RepID=A0A5C8ZUS0_9GAMM|nr:type II secretion system protein GspK [Parahaliea maris]TXS91217.1 general secretion pathway protein GspK [Parahaliea maris]
MATVIEARRRGSGGAILLSALWLLVLMSLMVTALTWSTRYSIRAVSVIRDTIEARYLAEGAFQVVYGNLMQRRPDDRLLGDGEVLDIPIGEGHALVRVNDEHGKVDINYAGQALLARLFYSLDVEMSRADSLAAAILDYRDEDHLNLLNGAEDDDYQKRGLAWEAKDAPFTSIEELRQVLGMEPEIFEALRPLVTVHTLSRGVNPEVASLPVLMAISNDSEATLVNYVAQRRSSRSAGLPAPRPPSVDRRFLTRVRGVIYTLSAVGITGQGERSGLSTTIRLRRSSHDATITTLEWRPYLHSDVELEQVSVNEYSRMSPSPSLSGEQDAG